MSDTKIFTAKGRSPGKASGPALVTRGRLGLCGFFDREQGTFSGGMGELEGASFGGTVLIFSSSKGSTLWSIELDLICRSGHAPAAIVTSRMDPFVTLGCVLQDIPLVQVEDLSIFDQIKMGDMVTVDADRGEVI